MSIVIDNFDSDKFVAAHNLFLDYMFEKSDGIQFVSFHHPFLRDDEIKYKWKVYADASDAICFSKWQKWKDTPGKIFEAVQLACSPIISANLLEHRFGPQGNSDSPLHRVHTRKEISSLEEALYSFMQGGKMTPDIFGIRFNAFADYLKKNKLGCKWPFLAYLSFLRSPEHYFPILPGSFQRVLHCYGIDIKLSGKVEWSRYRMLLLVADEVKKKLSQYQPANLIEIQSYIWVISYLIKDKALKTHPKSTDVDFSKELDVRVARAKERERIGLIGEEFVFNSEKKRLCAIGREDLADQVRLISSEGKIFGYDILSFDESDCEIHIEVKTTKSSSDADQGFWLSQQEKDYAEKHVLWRIFRVWDIDAAPHFQDIGNIILEKSEKWEVNTSTWRVLRICVD
ncbi:MAG: DUF3883 domain-containing protein [Candidatus Marinimicrobia bacterium]|nr:DUF3883 domain-containing protein [Candidatus Neomarinimicrobiota bacterium]